MEILEPILEPIFGVVGEVAVEILGELGIELGLEIGAGVMARAFDPEQLSIVAERADPVWVESASRMDDEKDESIVPEEDTRSSFIWLKLSSVSRGGSKSRTTKETGNWQPATHN